jgi:hypothetical protein
MWRRRARRPGPREGRHPPDGPGIEAQVQQDHRPGKAASIFTADGAFRSAADRQCLRCGQVLVGEDAYGAYYPAGAYPDDRVYRCGGQPHRLPTGLLTRRGMNRFLLAALAAQLLLSGLSVSGVITLAGQLATQSVIIAVTAAVITWCWARTRRTRMSEILLIAVAVGTVSMACAAVAAAISLTVLLYGCACLAGTAVAVVTAALLRKSGWPHSPGTRPVVSSSPEERDH